MDIIVCDKNGNRIDTLKIGPGVGATEFVQPTTVVTGGRRELLTGGRQTVEGYDVPTERAGTRDDLTAITGASAGTR